MPPTGGSPGRMRPARRLCRPDRGAGGARAAGAARRCWSMRATAPPGRRSTRWRRGLRRRGRGSTSCGCTTTPTRPFRTASRTRSCPRTAAGRRGRCVAAGADLGVAWDGDFDRCFLFDETGAFVAGEYVVALLAARCWRPSPAPPSSTTPAWSSPTPRRCARGGRAAACRRRPATPSQGGDARDRRASMVARCRRITISATSFYCDSGMMPWLKVAELMGREGVGLGELVADLRARYPSSGEINFTVADPAAAIERVVDRLGTRGAGGRPPRRGEPRFRRLADEPARLLDRAAVAPQPRDAGGCGAAGREDGGDTGAGRRVGLRTTRVCDDAPRRGVQVPSGPVRPSRSASR